MTASLRGGSLFSGYGGLDLGVAAALERVGAAITPAWFVEFDPMPSRILAHHWPTVPNLGDVTTVDWADVESVDVLTGGFPCQDLSLAGRRSGMRPGTRSGLWADYLRAIVALHPTLVVIENVRGLLSGCAESDLEPCPGCVGESDLHRPVLRALGRVLGDLADVGFDAVWAGVRASDAGAPHERFRVFVVAWPADPTSKRLQGGRVSDGATGEPRQLGDANHEASTDDDGEGRRSIGWFVAGQRDADRRGSANPKRDRGEPAAPADAGRRRRGADLGALRRGEPDAAGRFAADADDPQRAGERREQPRRSTAAGRRALAATDTERSPGAEGGHAVAGEAEGGGASARSRRRRDDAHADAAGRRRGGRAQEPIRGAKRGTAIAGSGGGDRVEWGPYRPAVERWERVTGNQAPSPVALSPSYLQVIARRRAGLDKRPVGHRGSLVPRYALSAALPEWMMGLRRGWVTDPAIWDGFADSAARNAQIKACGNGVVPQQADLAVTMLLAYVPAFILARLGLQSEAAK